jgi:hypothetical protein
MARIGELLVAEGVLSEVAVQSALGFQRHTGEPFRLGTILLDRDLLGEESLLRALAALHRCDYVTWADLLRTEPRIIRMLPERAAVRLAAIPCALEGRGIRVAFKNPSNLAAVDEVSALTSRPVIPAVISEVRLLQAFHLFYGRPIPIEFRTVLHKLERNEERRLHRTGAAESALTGRFVNAPRPPSRDRPPARPIPISRSPVPPPAGYAAPFLSAELPQSELADAAEFLPDFAPRRALSPEELAARMWTDEPEAAEAAGAPPSPASVPASASPTAEAEAEAVARTPARDQIAETALDGLEERFPRVLLLSSAQDSVQGWTGRGSGLTRERIGEVRIPWGEPSIFAFVKLSGSPHRGPLSRILLPPALVDLLGEKGTGGCAVYPVRIKDRLVAFLYADRLGAPLFEDDYRSLEVAASSLGSSLARLLLELRRAAPAR